MNSKDPIRSAIPYRRGNVKPLLNEIIHALDRLLDDDEPTVIDLASLPFAPGELEQLEQALGRGELNAELDALGKSHIRETAYPGVWWLEHRNTAGEIVGRYIEITRTPEILMSQDADIGAGRAKLRDSFEDTGNEFNKEAGK
ncbi:MAG: hydrogenase expression/formation protein [Gammaproteobacteria bacterium]|jgi:hydrogenase-1 operon protein HyaF|nr:hydrogenase expression/formation protein [Gammaproteobacteria bacterium]